MTTVDVGRPRNGDATHAQLHDSRLDRALCHVHGTTFPSIACNVAYVSRPGRQKHEQLGVGVSRPRALGAGKFES